MTTISVAKRQGDVAASDVSFADRLDFTLPDFTRLSWVGDEARAVWEPRLQRVMAAWREIEWLAVAEGVRPCCVTIDTPEQFLACAGHWARRGLGALPVELTGLTGQVYSSTPEPYQPGRPFAFRSVVGRPADTAAFQDAWQASDQQAVGRLLGYPDCCREFFRRVWVDEGLVDTTWPMAVASESGDGRQRDVRGPWQANILWRWMGARAVPHLPCRFDCPATVALADQLVQVGRDAGFVEELDWLADVLAWPAQWSALHGIAEIKTPILKVSARTDATAGRYVVRFLGDRYPAEGAQGLDFPYRRSWRKPLTQSRGYRQGIDHALPVLQTADVAPLPAAASAAPAAASAPAATPATVERPATAPPAKLPAWYAADNGFASVAALEAAHAPVLALARETLGERGGDVLDLGCGNGALLKKLCEACPGVRPFGVELDPARVIHAHALASTLAEHVVAGDLFSTEVIWPAGRRYALALLMPGRLLEVDAAAAARLRRRLAERCDRVLVYAYGDWLDRFGTLVGLAAAAGLRLTDGEAAKSAALAAVDAGSGASATSEEAR